MVIGVIYILAIPLRWLPAAYLIPGYSLAIVGIGGILLLVRLMVRRISPDTELDLTLAIINAAGFVILLFPLTPTRGYVEMGQPFGFILGFYTSLWPLFIVVGVSVLLVVRLFRRAIGREQPLFMIIIIVLGFITIILCWLLFPILNEITPSHIAGLVISIQILILRLSKL